MYYIFLHLSQIKGIKHNVPVDINKQAHQSQVI
jgi:hypothetical protein